MILLAKKCEINYCLYLLSIHWFFFFFSRLLQVCATKHHLANYLWILGKPKCVHYLCFCANCIYNDISSSWDCAGVVSVVVLGCNTCRPVILQTKFDVHLACVLTIFYLPTWLILWSYCSFALPSEVQNNCVLLFISWQQKDCRYSQKRVIYKCLVKLVLDHNQILASV